jgi:(4S)-4-hydroxy-5-phosphonooxypentane-2,3-dione isomerase
MICLTVVYIIKPGHEEEAAELLRNMTGPTRAEPGNIMYQAHRSAADPRKFLLYEQYTGMPAFEAHRATAHFQEYIANGIFNIMESRTPEFFELLTT